MHLASSPLAVLNSLRERPSRASVAAIGHQFVLNGAPPALAIEGLKTIADMMCDWSVVILDEAIHDPTRSRRVRWHAFATLCRQIENAIELGYDRLGAAEFRRLAEEAEASLRAQEVRGTAAEPAFLDHLCAHLAQAVADGVFGPLPDF